MTKYIREEPQKYTGDRAYSFYIILYFVEKRSLKDESSLNDIRVYIQILLDSVRDINIPAQELIRGKRAIKKCVLYLEGRGLDLTQMYKDEPGLKEIVRGNYSETFKLK